MSSKADGNRNNNNGSGGAVAIVQNNIETLREMAPKRIAAVAQYFGDDKESAQRFMRVAVSHYVHAAADNAGEIPKMHMVEPVAYIAACMDAATDKLLPDGRDGWIIPYGTTCRWHPSWRGLVKLARRVVEFRDLSTEVVHKRDHFKVKLGGDRSIEHEPHYSLGIADNDAGPIIAVYAGARLKHDDFRHFEFRVVTRERLDQVAKKSGNPRNDEPSKVWREHFEAQCRKHAMRQFLDWIGTPDEIAEVLGREDEREEKASLLTVAQVPEFSDPLPRQTGRRKLQGDAGAPPMLDGQTGDDPPPPQDGAAP